jgi:hypothetical protein
MYQAIYRAIRATSHVQLLKLIREETGDPNARVQVNIYRHASVFDPEVLNDSQMKVYNVEKYYNDPTIELQMYQLSEYKDRKIGKVMRMLKECAVDCQIMYPRNKRSDKDYSAECNYLPCEYTCFTEPIDSTDYSTYDVYYLNEIVNTVIFKLKPMFLQKEEYDIEELIDRVPDIPAKFVVEGISTVIRKRIPIYNRFGYPCFLQEDGNRYFLVTENDFYTVAKADVLSSYYTMNLIGVQTNSLKETTDLIRKDADQEAVEDLLGAEDLVSTIEEIKDTKVLVKLIENILQKTNPTPEEKMILNKYKNFIFEFPEPKGLIQEQQNELTVKRKGRGRKKDPNKPPEITRLKEFPSLEELLGEDINEEPVKVHILNLLRYEDTGYKISSDYYKADTEIRIFKPSEGQWRTVSSLEMIPYNTLIQIMINEKLNEFLRISNLFGTVMPDGKFRIVDKSSEDPRAAKDLHHEKKGSICSHLNKENVYRYLAELRFSPPEEEFEDIPRLPFSDNRLREASKAVEEAKIKGIELDNEQKSIVYQWILTGLNKETMCKYMEEYLDSKNLIFRVL